MKTINNFMTKKLFMLCLITALCFFAACKKEDKVTTTPTSTISTTKTEHLTKAPWKKYRERSKEGNDPWDEWFIEPCELDNTWTYLQNNTMTFDEGASKCNPSDSQTFHGAWSIDNNGSTLTLNGAEFNIDVINNSTLKITHTSSFVDLKTELTFRH